jgi:hypothetical protein
MRGRQSEFGANLRGLDTLKAAENVRIVGD